MADLSGSITISAPPRAVFAFVSEISNLPQYLPTVKAAEDAGQGRVQVTSVVENESHTQDGYFRTPGVDQPITWGSDGDKDYEGSMLIEASEHGSNLILSLHLNPPPQKAEDIEARTDQDFASQMQEGINRCLQSIKNQVEGTGGKDEIPESRGQSA